MPFTRVGGRARDHVRGVAVLRAPGDRLVRGRRPAAARGVAHARRRSRPDVRARLPAPRGRRAASPAGCSPSRAGSASSARRSSSPATCAVRRRPSRSAIYEQLEANFDLALAIGVLLVVFSAAILLTYKVVTSWGGSSSTSSVALRSFTLDARSERRTGDGRARRPVRGGQDDGAARGGRAASRRTRAGSRSAVACGSTRGRQGRPAAGGALGRRRVPGVRAVPAHDGPRERRVRRRPQRPTTCSNASGSATWRGSSPAR